MTTFRIGELQVTRVEDFIMPQVPMKSLLPEVSEPAIQSNLHWLAPHFYDAANKTAAVPCAQKRIVARKRGCCGPEENSVADRTLATLVMEMHLF